jgi:hypothetical protein
LEARHPPFEQLVGQHMIQLQSSISKCLHHHTLSKMFFNKHLRPIMLEFYHVLTQGQAFGL